MLARTWALPTLAADRDVLAKGAALLYRPRGAMTDPTPVDALAVAAELRDLLAALPERADAGRPYADARLFALYGPADAVRAYLREAVAAVRVAAPRYRAPAGPRPAAMTAAERKRRSRTARRAAEVTSARCFLRDWLDAVEPGDRVAAADLYAEAVDEIGQWTEDAAANPDAYARDVERDGLPETPAVPGVKTFYVTADEVIAPRTRTATGYAYVVPETAVVDELLDRVAAMVWADHREQTLDLIARTTAKETRAA
ncbi:hypothetical protein DQE82_29620 [Micromonospora sp. LHW51205]|nr:hypothetical protein DQE82_29620 [Micromonospora sp. LHW51205]